MSARKITLSAALTVPAEVTSSDTVPFVALVTSTATGPPPPAGAPPVGAPAGLAASGLASAGLPSAGFASTGLPSLGLPAGACANTHAADSISAVIKTDENGNLEDKPANVFRFRADMKYPF